MTRSEPAYVAARRTPKVLISGTRLVNKVRTMPSSPRFVPISSLFESALLVLNETSLSWKLLQRAALKDHCVTAFFYVTASRSFGERIGQVEHLWV